MLWAERYVAMSVLEVVANVTASAVDAAVYTEVVLVVVEFWITEIGELVRLDDKTLEEFVAGTTEHATTESDVMVVATTEGEEVYVADAVVDANAMGRLKAANAAHTNNPTIIRVD